MTDRDTFAAAALTGLIVSMREESLYEELLEVCESAYGWADAMLRQRGTAVSATLTDAEREAVEWYASYGKGNHADTLRGLLERLK